MERGGKGIFQACKLQRSARATVCSHSTRDMAAMCSIELKRDHNETQEACLSSCGQWNGDLIRNGETPYSGSCAVVLIPNIVRLKSLPNVSCQVELAVHMT